MAVDAKTYEATVRCSQGPMKARFVAKGAKWGESVEIRACGAHGIRARALVHIDGKLWSHRSIGFGEDRWENERCVMRGAEERTTLVAGSGSLNTGVGGASAKSGTASQAPSTHQSAFRTTDFVGEVCPNSMSTFLYLNKVKEGAVIDVKIWSEQPNDFEQALVQIRHQIHWPSVSDKEWVKHLAKEERRERKREQEFVRENPSEEELRQRMAEAEVYKGPTSAPPPAQIEVKTPRLSVNAEWVPGYWHWNTSDWMWIAGNWRVPSEDVRLGRTLRAAYAPPALRTESIPVSQMGAMVWTSGYWSWNGGGYIWVAGVWRLRPSARAIWIPNRWQVAARGVLFIPGGWR